MDHLKFYQSTARVAIDDQPYGTTLTEASPLSRVTETRRAGDIDQVGQRRVAYQVNEAADQVRRWSVVRGTQPGIDGTALYAVGDLSKLKATDEDGRVSYVFQDQLGRMVLQRQVNQTGTTAQWLDTYTVYDEMGRVCYLVPPGAVAKRATAGQWTITDAAFINRWLYVYTYDNRGRLMARQFPGAQPTCLVYDAYDRPVLTQDGNQRATNTWSFAKFDAQGRPVVSGLYTESSTATALQAQVDGGTYGAYEERTATGYTLTQSFPVLSTTGTTPDATLLTQTSYDDYDLNGDGTADYSYGNQGPGADEPVAVTRPRGLPTVQKTRIIRGNNYYEDWLVTALFYDQYDNLVQKRSNNHLNLDATLPDMTTLVYRDHGFVPQVLRSTKSQRITRTQSTTVRNRFAYDHAGRLLSAWQQNVRDGVAEPEVLVARHAYNALGQLVEKNLHSTDAGTSFLQSVDLAYNINGQLVSMNNSALANRGTAYDDDNDVFGMELVRAQNVPGLSNVPRHDGKLSAVRWQVRNTRQQNQPQRERSYRFEYYGVGRLTDARYAAMTTPNQWSAEAGAYDERGITYDPNGNLMTLSRYTQDAATASPSLLDYLQYSYGPDGGNQLKAISDKGNATQGFRDQSTVSLEYPVDANGNLQRDNNKKVTFIYNAINKVQRQQGALGRVMLSDYAADGTLLHRTVYGVPQNGSIVTKTYEYIDGFMYEDVLGGTPILASVPTPEGRALALRDPAPQPDNLIYEYHLRDHQGNLRVAFRAQTAPAQLHLTMEAQADEEGAYPKFREVAATRDNSRAQQQTSSAAVVQFQTGPHVRLPAANGDQVKIDLFYHTPSGVQQYGFRSASPEATRAAKSLPLQLALAPVLLPAPSTTSDARSGKPAAWWPGVQFSISGLLAGRAARQVKALAIRQRVEPVEAGAGPPSGTPTAPAYVGWNVLDAAGDVLRSGRTVLPVTSSSTKAWDHATVNLPVDLSDTETRAGSLEVFLLNDGQQPVYFDSVTIRHPRPDLVISQENHYYPFGMGLRGVAVNTRPAEQVSKAQYNGGSELLDEVLDEAGVYSTPYRTYDPTIGRFQGVDPLADAFAPMTPYQFANNDPANYNDPTGAFGYDGPSRGFTSFGFSYGGKIYDIQHADPIGGGMGTGIRYTGTSLASLRAADEAGGVYYKGNIYTLLTGLLRAGDDDNVAFSYKDSYLVVTPAVQNNKVSVQNDPEISRAWVGGPSHGIGPALILLVD